MTNESNIFPVSCVSELSLRSFFIFPITICQTQNSKSWLTIVLLMLTTSILFEYENQVQETEPHRFLGLVFSMHELYKDSSGNEPKYPRYYRQAEKKLKREQRKDFLHKQSRQIANAYDCVCIEDLDMKAMSQALKFGKSVSDNGWGMFTAFLKYKLEEQGKRLQKVDKFFASSQTCSCCGYVNKETKNLSIRAWDCPECGTHHDRDVNAAINIRNEGMRIAMAV